MAHLIKDAAAQVAELRQQASLLKRWQSLPPNNKLLELAVGEVHEVREELEQPQVDAKKAAGEFADVFVFAIMYQLGHLPDLDVGERLTSVNGSGKKSNALEVLEQTLLEVQDDPEAMHQVMRQLVSLMTYNPAAFSGIRTIETTLNKVRRNRPPELYQASDELSEEDVNAKYMHLEKGTRMLRKHYGTTLSEELWRPHSELLKDWQHTDLSLGLLSQRLSEKAPTQPVAQSVEPWYAQGKEHEINQPSGILYFSA